MAPKRKPVHSEKLEEIKQMQRSWMKQRADQSESRPSSQSKVEDRRGKQPTPAVVVKKNAKQPNDNTPISWVVGGGQNKKNLRTRSASPSSKVLTRTSRPNSGSKVKQCPNSSSSRAEYRSRPPSGRSGVSSPPGDPSKGSSCSGGYRGVKEKPTSKSKHKSLISNQKYSSSDLDEFSHDSNVGLHTDSSRENASSVLNRSLSETDLTAGIGKTGSEMKTSIDQSNSSSRDANQSVTVVANGLLDPSQFDSLAERLSQKVRGHILEEERKAAMDRGVTSDSILLDGETHSNSHACPKCKQTMVPPDHTPTLLVPCGHTLCEPCAEDRIKCPACRTKVTSTSVNESLLEIIMKSTRRPPGDRKSGDTSNRRPPSESLNEPGNHSLPDEPGQEKTYDPLKFTGGKRTQTNTNQNSTLLRKDHNGYSPPQLSEFHSTFAPLKNSDPSEQRERYEEEYESLSIRCEAYENEEVVILERVKKKSQEIDKQKNQIDNIHREQQRIRNEVQSLQERLSVLASHEQEFNRQRAALDEMKEGDLQQLETVRNTKKGLEKQREKIKILGRGIGLFFD